MTPPDLQLIPVGRRSNRKSKKALVLVHGYGSTCESNFNELLWRLLALDPNAAFSAFYVNYDTRAGLRELGQRLGQVLQGLSDQRDDIRIVGYSMGGLVARMALIETDLPKVTRLITLASPNQGVFGSAHLSRQMQWLLNNGMTASIVWRRAQGVRDMRQAHECFRSAREEATYPVLNTRLAGKRYITIPANYFHQNRPAGSKAPSEAMQGAANSFKAVNAIADTFAATVGFGENAPAINLTAPHDGLVTLPSAFLLPQFGGAASETKNVNPQPTPPDWILAQMAGDPCYDVDHVSVLRSEPIAHLVSAMLTCADPANAVTALQAKGVNVWREPPP